MHGEAWDPGGQVHHLGREFAVVCEMRRRQRRLEAGVAHGVVYRCGVFTQGRLCIIRASEGEGHLGRRLLQGGGESLRGTAARRVCRIVALAEVSHERDNSALPPCPSSSPEGRSQNSSSPYHPPGGTTSSHPRGFNPWANRPHDAPSNTPKSLHRRREAADNEFLQTMGGSPNWRAHATTNEVSTESAQEWKGRGKREIPEKTRRPAAMSDTIFPLVKTREIHSRKLDPVRLAVNLLASHQGDPNSIPGRVTPDFRMWESCRLMPLVGRFSRRSPVYPALSFRRYSKLIGITLIGSQDRGKRVGTPFANQHLVTYLPFGNQTNKKSSRSHTVANQTQGPFRKGSRSQSANGYAHIKETATKLRQETFLFAARSITAQPRQPASRATESHRYHGVWLGEGGGGRFSPHQGEKRETRPSLAIATAPEGTGRNGAGEFARMINYLAIQTRTSCAHPLVGGVYVGVKGVQLHPSARCVTGVGWYSGRHNRFAAGHFWEGQQATGSDFLVTSRSTSPLTFWKLRILKSPYPCTGYSRGVLLFRLHSPLRLLARRGELDDEMKDERKSTSNGSATIFYFCMLTFSLLEDCSLREEFPTCGRGLVGGFLATGKMFAEGGDRMTSGCELSLALSGDRPSKLYYPLLQCGSTRPSPSARQTSSGSGFTLLHRTQELAPPWEVCGTTASNLVRGPRRCGGQTDRHPPGRAGFHSLQGRSRIVVCGNRGFSKGSPVSPRPGIPALLHTHLTSSPSALGKSMLIAAKISPLHSNLANLIGKILVERGHNRTSHPPKSPLPVDSQGTSCSLESCVVRVPARAYASSTADVISSLWRAG
ncbi:hypothetical protein PR048_031584 [Dryococelus australis]|uniref:Uncharacterized protein n=1 Tax=Dryococelus australis TaxID=614101 RepID=A0ABQ9G9R0_9NEOP|nr:hypothetical protein PR048_031584 [Dryococelus australis]